MKQQDSKVQQAWATLRSDYSLTERQIKQFEQYLQLLLQWNEDINLTAITQPYQIILDHFIDSLKVTECIPFETVHYIADVGSGAGFPGVPLKIARPDLKVILIEVTGKKIAFLRMLIETLELEDIEIYTLDWRTFLRKTNDDIDLFLSRASLAPIELIRMFKPSSPYKDKTLVYWGSKLWQPTEDEIAFIKKECEYQVGNKNRKCIVMQKPDV